MGPLVWQASPALGSLMKIGPGRDMRVWFNGRT